MLEQGHCHSLAAPFEIMESMGLEAPTGWAEAPHAAGTLSKFSLLADYEAGTVASCSSVNSSRVSAGYSTSLPFVARTAAVPPPPPTAPPINAPFLPPAIAPIAAPTPAPPPMIAASLPFEVSACAEWVFVSSAT